MVRKLLLLMHWLNLESGMSRRWFTCPLLFYVNSNNSFLSSFGSGGGAAYLLSWLLSG